MRRRSGEEAVTRRRSEWKGRKGVAGVERRGWPRRKKRHTESSARRKQTGEAKRERGGERRAASRWEERRESRGLAEEINNGLVTHVRWYTLCWKITYDTGIMERKKKRSGVGLPRGATSHLSRSVQPFFSTFAPFLSLSLFAALSPSFSLYWQVIIASIMAAHGLVHFYSLSLSLSVSFSLSPW